MDIRPEIFIILEVDVVHVTKSSTLITINPNLRSWNMRLGDEGHGWWPDTVARYQTSTIANSGGSRCSPLGCVWCQAYETLQMTRWSITLRRRRGASDRSHVRGNIGAWFYEGGFISNLGAITLLGGAL